MFGYIVANSKILSDDQQQRYKSVYCGLCRALKERHGAMGRLTLTYDMTFLVLLLSSLYEPCENKGSERCCVHPVKQHCFAVSDITAYAADMNVALAYLNQLDNWKDDKSHLSLLRAKLLKKDYDKVAEQYPRQCGAMISCLTELSELEKTSVKDPDKCAQVFGKLMGEIFVFRENDRWSPTLREMATHLGEFIYIMDAVVDLDKDIRHGAFNPLIPLRNAGRSYEDFHEILTMLIGECCIQFDKLPLVEDVAIMRNILCSGVWMKYELLMAKKNKKEKQANDL